MPHSLGGQGGKGSPPAPAATLGLLPQLPLLQPLAHNRQGGTGKLGIVSGTLSPVGQPPFIPRRVSLLCISEFQLRLLTFIY